MRKPARRTAPSYRWNNDRRAFDACGVITCECTGEWAGGPKCWTEIGKPCGNQYSLCKIGRGYAFILEATN